MYVDPMMRRILTSIAVIALLMFGHASGANATASRMKYVKKTVGVAPLSEKEAELTCPEGTQVIGGGVTLSSAKMRVTKSITGSSSTTSWSGGALNPTRAKQSMTVIADCAKVARLPAGVAITPTTSLLSMPPGLTGAFIGCPSGSTVTGGGFSTSSTDTNFRTIATGPYTFSTTGDSWIVNTANGTSSSQPLTLEVLCISSGVSMSYPFGETNAAPHTNTTLKVKCGDISQPTGGGYYFPDLGDDAGSIKALKPTGLGATPPGTGWASTADAGNGTHAMLATVACISLL
jgi:hypothetical protein